VTKRGKPVARVVPVEKPPSLIGTVEYLIDDDELIKPLSEDWEPWLSSPASASFIARGRARPKAGRMRARGASAPPRRIGQPRNAQRDGFEPIHDFYQNW